MVSQYASGKHNLDDARCGACALYKKHRDILSLHNHTDNFGHNHNHNHNATHKHDHHNKTLSLSS